MLIGDFAHRTEMEYSAFADYWSSVNTPNFLQVLRITGSDKVFSKYELVRLLLCSDEPERHLFIELFPPQNTVDPVKPTIEIPFNTFLDQWDAVGMINGPSIEKVFNVSVSTSLPCGFILN